MLECLLQWFVCFGKGKEANHASFEKCWMGVRKHEEEGEEKREETLNPKGRGKLEDGQAISLALVNNRLGNVTSFNTNAGQFTAVL